MPMDRMVGEAYILMRGDGTLLKRDFQKAGHEAGSAYSEAFDDELSNAEKGTLVRFRRNLAQATAEVDFSKFRREFGSVEKTFDGINRELDEMRRSGSLTVEQVSRVRKELLEWAEAETRAAEEAKRLSDQQKSLTQFFKDQEARLKRLNVAEKRRLAVIAESARAYNSYNRNIEFSAKKAEKAILDQDRAFRSYADNVRFSIERRAEPALLRMGRRIDDLGDRFVIYGDKVGRVFGKGSRNNFFNILGRSVGALVSGPMRLFVETAGKVSQVVGIMGKDFRLARLDGLGFGAAMGKSLQGALKAGLPGLAALAAGIAALAVILPTTVALLFTLAGALTAVVGAITLGVLGGLLALVPVVAALAGAFIVLGVSFARAGKEGTKAAESVKRLKESFKDFGESVKDTSDAVVEAFADTAEILLSQMTPFFVNMGEALADVANHFGNLLKSPEVRNFITEFSTVLPRVFENIGKGINNMIVGLLGFFSSILGPVERMSDGFARLGTRFREFATSPEGQTQMRDWFETAWGAAEDLWTILGNVATILGKIFTSGTEGPGQGFLNYLVEVTEKFDKWLSTPEGKSALEDFFVRVEELMITTKDALEDFGEALDKLDTDKAAQDAQSFADAMGTLAVGINTAATGLALLSGALGAVGSAISIPFVVGATLITGAIDAITIGLEGLVQWFSENTVDIGSKEFAESALVAPFAWAYDQLFGHSWIPDIVNGFQEWIPQIPGIIAGALAGVGEALVAPFRDAATNLLGILARLPGQILGFIVGIPGMISGALSRVTSVLPQPFQDGISAVRSRLSGFPGMVHSFVSGIPGVVSSALSGLAGAFSRPFATAYSAVSGWVSAIRTLISGIGASISGAASRVSSLASRARGLTPFASGGVVYGPTRALIGEAGREAVIPLDRPLNMVDPSVRALSAIAQGMKVPAMAAGGVAGGGRQIDVTVEQGAVQVVTKTTSPNVVGSIVLDGIADAIYTAVNG
ncbi:MAG: hypothetical protein E6R04_05240 [Spirochaetes bacterium]|nr:MAG: hypothetical protein E6R04_05240 [Spirochaetota bacterium]